MPVSYETPASSTPVVAVDPSLDMGLGVEVDGKHVGLNKLEPVHGRAKMVV